MGCPGAYIVLEALWNRDRRPLCVLPRPHELYFKVFDAKQGAMMWHAGVGRVLDRRGSGSSWIRR
jgi:hypothetical protein